MPGAENRNLGSRDGANDTSLETKNKNNHIWKKKNYDNPIRKTGTNDTER